MTTFSRRCIAKGQSLSPDEVIALRSVADRKTAPPLNCRLLKRRGLIEQRLGDWILTQQGHIHLLFCNAR
jgi:hypothetical protein